MSIDKQISETYIAPGAVVEDGSVGEASGERQQVRSAWDWSSSGLQASQSKQRDQMGSILPQTSLNALVAGVSQDTVLSNMESRSSVDQLMRCNRRLTRKDLTAVVLAASCIIAILLPLILVIAQVWKRCDSDGTIDPPIALLKRGNWSSDQVAMECIAGLLFGVYAAVPAMKFTVIYLRCDLDRAASTYGLQLVALVVFISFHASATGLSSCSAEDNAMPAVRDVMRVISDLGYAGAMMTMEVGVLMKVRAVHGRWLQCCRRLYAAWLGSALLALCHWKLFQEPSSFDRALFGCMALAWSASGLAFAALATSDLMRTRSGLSTTKGGGWRSSGADVRRALARDAACIAVKHVTMLLVGMAIAVGRRYGSSPLQNLCFAIDFIVSVPCGFLLGNFSGSQQVGLDEDVWLAELQQRLEATALQIKEDMHYDLRHQLEKITNAALKSYNAYGTVLADAFHTEPAAVQAVCSIPAQRIYRGRLCPLGQLPADADKSALDQGKEANTVTRLLEEARGAQQYLKELIAPGSTWATTELDTTAVAAMVAADGTTAQQHRMLRNSGKLLHFLDGAYDPGVKSEMRIKQKAKQKYKGNIRCVHDASRLALFCDSVERLWTAFPYMLRTFDVIEVDNRFAKPTPLGWMDITFLVRVPVELPDGRTFNHTAEIQLQLTSFYEARLKTHKYYRVVRSALGKAGVKPEHLDLVQHTLLEAVEA